MMKGNTLAPAMVITNASSKSIQPKELAKNREMKYNMTESK
jgi:hypothetical protein